MVTMALTTDKDTVVIGIPATSVLNPQSYFSGSDSIIEKDGSNKSSLPS